MAIQTPKFGQLSNLMGKKQQTIPDKAKQPQGTGYTNLQKVLGANQGNKLGQAVVGGITQAGDKTKQNLGQQQEQFGQALGKEREHQAGEQQVVQGAFQDLDKDTFQGSDIDEGEATGFKNLRSEQYGGPKGLENAEQLQRQAQQAAQYGKLANSREGRQELLRSLVGGKGYTSAQQRLDELFLGQNQGDLSKAARQQRQLVGETNRAIGTAQGAGKAQEAALQQLQNQAAQGIQTRQGTLNTDIASKLKAAQEKEGLRQTDFTEYQKAIAKGDQAAADAIMAKGNMNGSFEDDVKTIMALAGTDIGSTLANSMDIGSTPLTRGAVSSDMQRAQLDALSRLAGSGEEFKGYTPEEAKAASLSLNPDIGSNVKSATQNLIYNRTNPYAYNPVGLPKEQLANIMRQQESDILANPALSQQWMDMIAPTVGVGPYGNVNQSSYNIYKTLRDAGQGQTLPYTAEEVLAGSPFKATHDYANANPNMIISGHNNAGYSADSIIRQQLANALAQKYIKKQS